MKHLNLVEACLLPKAGLQVRKAVFLAEMEAAVLWYCLEPVCPKRGNGRPPMPLGIMLRIHFMQRIGYSAPAMEEALHDIPLFGQFAGLNVRALQSVGGTSRLMPATGEMRP